MTVRVCWRVDHGGVGDVEVDLRADTTVGEVAALLLKQQGTDPGPRPTLSHGGRPLPSSATVATAGPPAGATVGLVQDPGGPVQVPPLAPIHLDTPAGRVDLRYGTNTVAPGVVLDVGSQLRARVDGTAPLTRDGTSVRGNALLDDGALLRSRAWTATVVFTGPLRPRAGNGPTRPLPVIRGEWVQHAPEALEMPVPPSHSRPPGFPWLSAAIPLLMGGALWLATRSWLSVGFMVFSFAYVIAAGVEGRREARAEDRFRVEEFRSALAEAEAELTRRREAEERRDAMRHPGVAELLTWFDPVGHRVWERPPGHPRPVVVRLGSSVQASDDPLQAPRSGRTRLREEARRVVGRFATRPRPVTIDLAAEGVAIIGDDHLSVPLASALLFQVAALVPPGSVTIESASDLGAWRWLAWLPHRHQRASTQVVAVHRDSGVRPGVATDGGGGAGLVWVAPDTVGLPEGIGSIVHFDGDGRATVQSGHSEAIDLAAEPVAAATVELGARRMAPLVPGSGGGLSDGRLPDSVDLRDLGLGLSAVDVAAQWSDVRDGLPASIGRAGGGGVLGLDLVADGPHALVAGTTGSGKSELLRTLVASLASLHPPDRLNILLVDYKGGAAFGPLAGLPHCVGLVTDLSPTEVHRAITALRAEVLRRERILDRHGVSDLNGLGRAQRPPALVVVVDEFATLVAEVPAFLDGVLDLAQRGRSLGIHVVLATQRPAGVVSDAVRANVSMRIALRLTDAGDSVDVVDDPGASSLPRDVPGRALVRLGPDVLVQVQVAHGKVPATDPHPVRIRPLGRRPAGPPVPGPGSPSQLDAVVAAARAAATDLGLPPPRPPWIEPLPSRLPRRAVPPAKGTLAIGLVDLPHLQTRAALTVDLQRHGGLVAVGAPASGTSNTLMALAAAAHEAGGWTVHAIDATGGLAELAAADSVASVVDGADHEAVHRLLGTLVARIDGSRSGGDDRTLLLVDGFGAFEEQQRGINHGVAVDRLIRLATDGRRGGVVLAVAARRRSELPPLLAHALGERLVHRCVDPEEAAHWDAPADLADVTLPPGRVWRRGDWGQVATDERASTGAHRRAVGRLGLHIPLGDLPPVDDPSPWVIGIGVRADDLGTALVDLRRGHLLVAGPPRSGRTTTVATVLAAARRRGLHTRATGDDPRPVLRAVLDQDGGVVPTLVALDDLDEWLDDPEVDELIREVIRRGRTAPLRVVASAEMRGVRRGFSESVARLRAAGHGILLGRDASDHGDLLHVDLRRRDDLPPAAGRGWLVADGEGEVVQVAVAARAATP